MTLREFRPVMSVAWPYKHECRGHDSAKKSVKADGTCAVGKVLHLHTVDDSV